MNFRRCERCGGMFKPEEGIWKPSYCVNCSLRKVYSTRKKPTDMSKWL